MFIIYINCLFIIFYIIVCKREVRRYQRNKTVNQLRTGNTMVKGKRTNRVLNKKTAAELREESIKKKKNID
jgi:hypothetical protein